MDRSTGAGYGYTILALSDYTTLQDLSLLEQLKQKTKEEFLDAMKFIRPGYDD